MNAYLAQIRMNLRLTMRDRSVLFFSYLFPLLFFFMFGQIAHADEGGAAQIVNMVLTIGVLGSGFFGAAMRAIGERERNILRRFKVAPISAGPILVSSLVTGLVTYLPLVVLVFALAHSVWGMPLPRNMGSLLLFLSLGVIAFRALGGIIAAVANSMQEGQVLVQIFYTPMLLLGGATIPLTIMPEWLQITSQFLPATHFSSGIQGILLRHESILDNLPGTAALLATAVVATFLAAKLFRWDKDEKLRPSAKLWVLGVLAPFIGMGVWQSYAKTNLGKEKIAMRELSRSRNLLIRDVNVFVGDGKVLENESVLVRDGKIAEMFAGRSPDPKSLKAEAIDGAGKTLLPGLIDVHVHLGASGALSDQPADYSKADENIDRELAAYLYSGVTTVKSVGDELDRMLKHRGSVRSGEALGADLFAVGPMFTTEGGHGDEFAQYVPERFRAAVEQQMVRKPKTAAEARTQVNELKKAGVDGIKAILDAGAGSTHYNRLDPALLRAVAEASKDAGLPIVCHTGEARDIADALDAGVNGIEHGSLRDSIPEALFERMKDAGATYDPTLAVMESLVAFSKGSLAPLEHSLVAQVTPRPMLESTTKLIASTQLASMRSAYAGYPVRLDLASENLAAAYRHGVTLVAGTDAGNPLMVHGPGLHHELALWVKAGIPRATALQAATYNAARLLRADNRIGLVREGYDANLLLVDGNPLEDISATERISEVIFHGERVNRSGLFKQE